MYMILTQATLCQSKAINEARGGESKPNANKDNDEKREW